MVSVTISHVIGTTTLIVVFISVTMFYTISYFSLQTETLARQLQEVADYVSANLVDLVSLCSISPSDQLLIKGFDMPESIGTYVYNVTLKNTTNPVTQEKLLVVRASFVFRSSVYRDSLLPWSMGGKLKFFNPLTPPEIDNPKLHPETYLLSSTPNSTRMLVAWALKRGEETTVGLGVMNTG